MSEPRNDRTINIQMPNLDSGVWAASDNTDWRHLSMSDLVRVRERESYVSPWVGQNVTVTPTHIRGRRDDEATNLEEIAENLKK